MAAINNWIFSEHLLENYFKFQMYFSYSNLQCEYQRWAQVRGNVIPSVNHKYDNKNINVTNIFEITNRFHRILSLLYAVRWILLRLTVVT